ncbi:MAG: thiamine-binding protein [Ilumatobacteraceae bacterium]|nr:thiamine-binding protein [Ilumatobacteraceae bacterium]
MHQLEFTIEPFVEGRPGPHVTAAIEALEALGATVDVGPFGSSCTGTTDQLPELVAAVTRAALANGATHVTLDIGVVTDRPEGSS